MPPEDAMFQEVHSALQQGDRPRARDLLTRLLRRDQANAEYWLWMSAVVETPKERIYCLNQVLRLDPSNQAARRGLVISGVMPVQEDMVLPLRLQKREWQVQIDKPIEPRPPLSMKRLALYAGGGVLVAGLILLAIFAPQLTRERSVTPAATISFLPVAEATAVPTPAVTPSQTSTPAGPTPPWEALEATYTPTPLAGLTPHPIIEAYQIALRAFERREWDRVITFLNQAVQAESSAADIHTLIGETYRLQAAYSQALEAFNNAISADPAYAPAYLGRARVSLALSTQRREDVRGDLETAVSLDADLAEAYLELAKLDLEEEKYEQALAALEQAAARLPDSPLLYLYRAQVFLALDQPAQALQDALKANQLDITMLEGYRVLGQAYQANDRFVDSITPLDIFQRYTDQPSAQVYIWLGQAYVINGEVEAALQSFNQALALDRSNFDVLLQRGQLYLQMEEYRLALADFNQAQTLRSNSFEAALLRSRALLGIEAFGDAYIQLSSVEGQAESDEQKAELYYWRAKSLEPLNVQAAIQDWNRLLSLPEGAAPQEWLQEAELRRAALVTPTNTPRPSITPTPTLTRVPTQTQTMVPATATYTATPTRTLSSTGLP